MGLSSAIEFLSAQRGPSGELLTAPGGSQVAAVIPALTTVHLVAAPVTSIYAHYTFRAMLDTQMVPEAFRLSMYSFGAVPYSGILRTSTRGQYLDFFLRVTHASPGVYDFENLTNLNQQFIIYTQHLTVATEEVFKELELRLDRYFSMDTGISRTNALLESIATGASPPADSSPQVTETRYFRPVGAT